MLKTPASITRPWIILLALLALMVCTVAVTISASAERHARGHDVSLSQETLLTLQAARIAMSDARYRERNAVFEHSQATIRDHALALAGVHSAFRDIRATSEEDPTREGALRSIATSWKRWSAESERIVGEPDPTIAAKLTMSEAHLTHFDAAASALLSLAADESKRLDRREEELKGALDGSSRSVVFMCAAMVLSLIAVSVLLRRDRLSGEALVDAERRERIVADRQAERLAHLVNRLPIAAIHNLDGKLTLNRAAEKLTGYDASEIQTVDDWFRLTAGHHAGAAKAIYEERRSRGFPDVRARAVIRKNGEILHLQFAGYGDQTDEIWIFRDVTGEREAKEALERANVALSKLAATDDLTGLYNQRAFRKRLDDEVDQAIRSEAPLSLLLMDVDHFKAFNDALGHLAGDAALHVVAQIIQSHERPGDLAARYGGEEFALLLPNTGLEEAFTIAEAIRNEVERAEWARPITISVGIGTLGQSTTSFQLVDLADRALYVAKAAGRNRVMKAIESVRI